MKIDTRTLARLLLAAVCVAGPVAATSQEPVAGARTPETPPDDAGPPPDGAGSGDTADRPPLDTDLREQVTTRRVVVDLTASGPDEALDALRAEDLVVRAGLRRLHEFSLDRVCPLRGEPDPVPYLPPATGRYLFYFEASMISAQGRHRAMMLSRRLIPRLIEEGNLVSIVSSGRAVDTFLDWTADADAALDALERLEDDRRHFDMYMELEPARISEVLELLESGFTLQQAMSRARRHQMEETFLTRRAVYRLRSVLGRFEGHDPPKGLVLFADRLRMNAGEHYGRFFGDRVSIPGGAVSKLRSAATALPAAFDSLIHDLIFRGIRVYSVESSPALMDLGVQSTSVRGQSMAGANAPSPTARLEDARTTLASIARETGGRSFTEGTQAGAVMEGIEEDLSCLFLLSFDPGDFREDTVHTVTVRSKDPRVTFRHRGRFVLASESRRRTARLLGAFVAPDRDDGPKALRVHLVPLDFRDGRFEALLQIQVSGLSLAGATWDLGSSLVRREKVVEERARRIRVDAKGVPAVLESTVRFKPGELTLLTVAQEESSRLVLSGSTDEVWASPVGGGLGPWRVLQPQPAVFVRDDETRSSGAWVRGEGEPVDRRLGTAFVGLACRGRGEAHWSVEREIEGASTVGFAPLELDDPRERCIQVRDLAPPASLGDGAYVFRARLLHRGQLVASIEHPFVVGASDGAPVETSQIGTPPPGPTVRAPHRETRP